MPNPLNLAGQRFGRLTVIGKTNARDGSHVLWSCLCDCGRSVLNRASRLKNATRSCGCLSAELSSKRNRRHGHYGTPEYNVWAQMKARCYNTKSISYQNYGARGIGVCERWRNSFRAFFADMGRRPSPSHEIDRVDNDGNYEPSNCRWSTVKEQANNRRTNTVIQVRGERLTIEQAGSRFGISPDALAQRLRRGIAPEDAVSRPLQIKHRHT